MTVPPASDEPRAAGSPLPGTVKGLAAVSLFNDLASEMVYPLLPAFVTTTLGGGAVALGALDGAADLAAASLRWWSGRIADRPGRRGPLVLAGYLLAIVLRPLVALTTQAWQVVGVRVLDRVGKGLRSPARDALIADATPPAVRGRAFGLHRTADHLGAVLGSLLAFQLLRRGTAVRDVLALSLVPGLLAALVLVVALRAARREAAAAPRRDEPADDGPVHLRPLAAIALLSAVRLPETLLLLRLQDLGAAVATIPLVWAVLHVVKSAASYPAGILFDRLGARAALGAGTVLYAATVFALGRIDAPLAAIGVFLAHGLAGGLLEPAERAAVAGAVPNRRGRAFGVYQGLAGLGALAAGLGYGWVYQVYGGGAALTAGAVAAAVAWVGWLGGSRPAAAAA